MEKAAALRALESLRAQDVERRQQIDHEIAELRSEYDRLADSVEFNCEFCQRIRNENDRIVTRPQTGTVQGQVINAAEAIIRAEGPQHRKKLLAKLEALGIVVGGQQPVSNMSAYMSRDHRFSAGGDGVWYLADITDDDSPDSLLISKAALQKSDSEGLESHLRNSNG